MVEKFDTNFIHEAIEKTPFADKPARNFFAEWCRINDSIAPEFVSRQEWEKRKVDGMLEEKKERPVPKALRRILDRNYRDKQKLFLPEDLHLWEMMDVIRTIDRDTFADKPEVSRQKVDEIYELGKTFQKAGEYLLQYLPDIKAGQDIAQTLGEEFYSYGRSLQEETRKTNPVITFTPMLAEMKQKLDEWFLGRDAYQKRMSRLGDNPAPEQIEERRKKLLQVYFGGLAREGYQAEGEDPWETNKGPMRQLQANAQRHIIKQIETPEKEMKTTIFRRGMEQLVAGMKERSWRSAVNLFLKKMGLDLQLKQETLYDVLQVPKLKQELEVVRMSGDVRAIAAKELETAKIIQNEVSRFPFKGEEGTSLENEDSFYKFRPDNPRGILESQYVNCLGAAILGGGIMDKVGLKYLSVSMPGHALTFLVTSDKKIYWQDFTPPGKSNMNYLEVTTETAGGKEIIEFAQDPRDAGLSISMDNIEGWTTEKHGEPMKLFLAKPEIGLQGRILHNTAMVFKYLGADEQALEAYKQAIALGLKDPLLFIGLGDDFSVLGREDEAIEAYKEAIALDPDWARAYNNLGNAFFNRKEYDKALQTYQKGIELDPLYALLFNGLGNTLSVLGKKEEGIVAYEKIIALFGPNSYLSAMARNRIEKLRNE